MKMRLLLGAVSVGFSALSAAGSAQAQAYPERPINLVVPYAAGGATDVIARLVATDLSSALDETIVVVNKPGAGTTLAAAEIARTKPDGYTLYMTTAAHTISASLYNKLNYDPIADFAPITLVAKIPIVLVTTPSASIKTLAQYIEHAKSKPEGISVGSPGNGSPQHLAQALFKERTGANFVHIPYRGDAPLITDLIAGQVESAFITLSAALPHIKANKLKAIAVANPTRINVIPDVPTMNEAGVADFNAATWFGLFAPSGISEQIQETIYKSAYKVVAAQPFVDRIESMGGEVVNIGPKDFQRYVKEESAQWAKAVKASGAKVD
ncbi:Bug family tripartite tricarboxylate transporter substrate binding protein [Pollutimonas nitritireducens]|nr:tripartite tricarboxylate transporter substrate binding protein [Pollutimonas nitritireducens]